MRTTIRVLICAGAVAIGLSACGGSSGSGHSNSGSSGSGSSSKSSGSGSSTSAKGPASVTVDAAKIDGQTVLVTSRGYALYVFQPDNGKKVTCNSDCQSVWPAEVAPATGDAKAGAGVKQSLIGSLPNPATGGRIVSYDGWPLYTYVSDSAPGQANGQNIDLNGGYWWLIASSGTIIK